MYKKKEVRLTRIYLISYWLIRGVGKVFAPINLLKYHHYFRELRMIFRTGMWSVFVKEIGKGSKIDSNVTIRYNPKRLEIGKYSHIDVGVNLEVHKKLKIGDFVHVAPNAYIQSGDKVIIEDYVGIGNGAKIYSKSNTYNAKDNPPTLMSGSAPIHRQKYTSGPIRIKQNAFIGLNTIVLPGVTIGRNSKIGPNSVVTKDIPDNVVAIGIPARPISKLKPK
tara:strand:- start:596 stop:1258 length:663 start_codon:yes stop_codon:yes gene_type:complete